MAFDPNFTLSIETENDATFSLVKINNDEYREATLSDGTVVRLDIKHEAKKRERHVVKMLETIPATSTASMDTVSVHIVIDQGLSPNSNDARVLKLAPALSTWVLANLARILRGES